MKLKKYKIKCVNSTNDTAMNIIRSKKNNQGIVALVNMILSGEYDSVADLNQDSNVNAGDLSLFVTAWNADDFIDTNHPMYFGKPGAFGSRGSNFIVQNCDFYLSIGSRLPFMVTGYDSRDFARKAKKIMVDIDKVETSNSYVKLDIKLNGKS